MNQTAIHKRLPALAALAALMLGGAVARAQEPAAAPLKPAPLSAGAHFSGEACGRQAGRGLANIALCWLELPYQIKNHLENETDERPTTVFVPLYDFVAGTVHGTVATAERLVGGAIELITSPIPTYEPLMTPPYPPFLYIQPIPVAAPTPAPSDIMPPTTPLDEPQPVAPPAPQ